jgi:hypothetical protein
MNYTEEELRMQMLAGIITEGQLKAKLEEGIFSNMFKSKDNSKEKALEEISQYNFTRLFLQLGNIPYSNPKPAIGRIDGAKKEMPKVAELLPKLFEVGGGGYYVQCSMMLNGERVNGVIPASFQLLLGPSSMLSDEIAKGKIKDMIIKDGI